MSFQAYLDNIEAKTGKTPAEFVAMAKAKGYDSPDTKAGVIVDWLKADYGLGRGHAMALVHVIRNGAQISDKHVGTTGVHRDESDMLRLDGKGGWPGPLGLGTVTIPFAGGAELTSASFHVEPGAEGGYLAVRGPDAVP